jgi:hypothetical protein
MLYLLSNLTVLLMKNFISVYINILSVIILPTELWTEPSH